MTSSTDSLGLLGVTIAGKYAIETVVGQGGFATVYRAMHVLWKRPVAVKVFKALGEVGADQRQQLLDDFIQEGALLADLSERSAAICQARDIGMLVTPKGESVPYMVLEWLEGKTLEELLESERKAGAPRRGIEDTVRLLEPIAEALALAHKKGIAHRDVKPANIFVLNGDPRDAAVEAGASGVKLLDFGIAKVVQDAQKMGFGKTAGHITSFTPVYGAPEQFNRAYGSTGPWTDVFAFALILAEVISGQEPMPGDTLVQLAVASSDENRRPTPRSLGVLVSDDIEAVFQKAVAVKPEQRYQTAGEFWNALRGAVFGDASRRSLVGGEFQIPLGSAATMMADASAPIRSGPPSSAAGAASSPTSATYAGGSKKSRTGLVVGVAVAALALAGATAFALRGGVSGGTTPGGIASDATGARASGSAGGSPSASASGAGAAAAGGADGGACPKGMIAIPGGEFFMGSEEKDAFDFEKPVHKVKLSPFCLDEFEVTVEQYKECSDSGGCRRARPENDFEKMTKRQKAIYDPLCNASDPVAKAKHPINCIEWDQAREACEARGGRLPTEAEWEFAARGPDGRIYPWGDDPPSGELLNACGKECFAWQKVHKDPAVEPAFMYAQDDGHPNTAPIGSFPKGKSRYGIQDVVGNVWEWVGDWDAAYPKDAAPSVDPKGPATGTRRVIRGGSWNGTEAAWVRPSFRFSAMPTDRSHGYGFRCAKSR